MRRLLAATAGVLALAGPATAADESPPPALRTAGPFLLETVYEKTHGNWAGAWQTLYPAHKRIASRSIYVRCERETPFPAELKGIRVLATEPTLVDVAGLARPVPGVAVTVEVSVAWHGPRDLFRFTHVFHLVPHRGHWTWILSEESYRDYAEDACLFRPAV